MKFAKIDLLRFIGGFAGLEDDFIALHGCDLAVRKSIDTSHTAHFTLCHEICQLAAETCLRFGGHGSRQCVQPHGVCR